MSSLVLRAEASLALALGHALAPGRMAEMQQAACGTDTARFSRIFPLPNGSPATRQRQMGCVWRSQQLPPMGWAGSWRVINTIDRAQHSQVTRRLPAAAGRRGRSAVATGLGRTV